MDKKRFKEWLETEAEKENLKIKTRFIKDDYTPRAKKDGTITIPDCTFDKTFKSDEQKAVGLHEIAHLKYRHVEIEENWLNKKFLFLVLVALSTILLAFGLYLLGFDSGLSTIVIIGVLFALAVKFLRKVLPQYFHLRRLSELEADKYAKERMGNAAPLVSYLGKSERFKEKWRKKGLIWRAKIWRGDKTHPSKSERIEHLNAP